MKYIEIHLYTDVIWNEQEKIWNIFEKYVDTCRNKSCENDQF